MNELIERLRPYLTVAMLRWWIVGGAFIGVNLGLLWLCIDVAGLPVFPATLIASEVGTLLRFLINDRWVFGNERPTLKRLWQYHVATVGSFVIWLTLTNLLASWGVHYAIASLGGMCGSVLLSVFTNFLWIWRHEHANPPA